MYAVIRLRSGIGVKGKIKRTLELLNLTRQNHCVIVGENELPMLRKVKDYVTWGEIDRETLKKIILKRGRLPGNKRLDENKIQQIYGKEVDQVVEEIMNTGHVEGMKKVFRLSPPKKGYKSIKRHYPKGDLGYRGDAINELLKRMI